MPDDLDVSVELRNWLFALEGTEEVGDCFTPTRGGDRISREEKCWHSTFRNLHVSGKSSNRLNLGDTGKASPKRAFPVDRFKVPDCHASGFQFGIPLGFKLFNCLILCTCRLELKVCRQ